MKKVLTVVGIILGAGLIFGLSLWLTLVSAVRGETVKVPDVTGLALPVARARLADAGLNSVMNDAQTVFSDFVTQGAVAVQDPSPGSTVKRARTIELVLSRGSRREVIPDLTGLTVEEAAKVVSNYQLRLTSIDRVYDARPAGTVISQTPSVGTSGIVDNRVKILLSRGQAPQIFIMPDLMGRQLVNVETMLTRRNAPFIVKTFANQIEDKNVLFVKEQYPLPGYPISSDETITLKVVEREKY